MQQILQKEIKKYAQVLACFALGGGYMLQQILRRAMKKYGQVLVCFVLREGSILQQILQRAIKKYAQVLNCLILGGGSLDISCKFYGRQSKVHTSFFTDSLLDVVYI